MGGATLSLPRLPLGSLCSPIFSAHAVFSLLFSRCGAWSKATSSVYQSFVSYCFVYSFLCLTRAQREVKYEELTLAEFVAEYAQVLLCKDISPLERTEREKHLVSLTYFAQQQEWSVILNFHGSVLLDIERGLVTWGDFYLHLESRTLSGHPHRRTGRGGEGGCSAPKFWATQIFWAARENLGKASF